MNPLNDKAIRRLLVVSHPGHEGAIFGIVQRLHPRIVFLTDGGGEPRASESREALRRIGLTDNARFLDFREHDFYRGLLDRNLGYFREVIARLRSEIDDFAPEQVICDAVEFYNPVHDLALPIVRAALGASSPAQVFEMPLIRQIGGQPAEKAENPESYELQRFPVSRREGQIEFHLDSDEISAKLFARDRVYGNIRQQLGPVLARTPDEHFATEVIAPAATEVMEPNSDQPVRYDWRAKLLLSRGEVKSAITRAEHYVPMAAMMMKGAG